ncbi:hypothetical protein C5B91_15650 [Haloferax sp. Atlit-10N]|nr:hypothetical protein C5B86_16215 [Haloferax sp. Atlit-19N]RDZ42524.1 hypothetical protein C5B87_16480 [Haloferax sp. Atlit-16N]RDZ57397.1 hypothetical protein C5B91_15650 [Haloferax sp. Atlit-10N]
MSDIVARYPRASGFVITRLYDRAAASSAVEPTGTEARTGLCAGETPRRSALRRLAVRNGEKNDRTARRYRLHSQ